jgi:hypothetical protein
MTPKTLRLRRLTTLAPTSSPAQEGDRPAEDETAKILDRERMARAVAITAATSACRRRLDSRHGVEPGTWSRFWATEEEDDDSEIESEEDVNTSTPVLIREAVQAGFLIEQLWQAEEELASPSTPATKIKSKTSLSNKIVEVWVENRRKKGAPWKGPLPEPRISPSRTLGDVLTVAMQNRSHTGKITTLTFHGSNQEQSSESSDRSWRKPSLTGNKGRLKLRCDLASITDFPILNSISKPSPESHRASSTGRDRHEKQPNMRFNPAKGLVKLFSRMGRRHKNPSAANTKPPKLLYAEVLRTTMDNRGNTSLDNRPGMAHRGHGVGGNRVGQVGTFGRPPFHRQFVARGGP